MTGADDRTVYALPHDKLRALMKRLKANLPYPRSSAAEAED